MAKFSTLILLYFILAAAPLAAQSKAEKVLHKAAEACEQARQGSYTVLYKHKFFASSDTLAKTGDVYFQKSADDKIGAKLKLMVAGEADRIYNGHKLYLIDHQQKTILQVDNAAGAFNFIRGNPSGNLILNPLAVDSDVFQQLAGSRDIQKSMGKAAKVAGVSCYTLTVRFADNAQDQAKNSYRIYYIGKKDFLPRKYEDFLEWQGQQQYIMVELKNLQVNQPQDTARYSINALPDDYKIEKYTPAEQR